MIMVISGTKEARDIMNLCGENNWPCLALVVTKYGKGLTQSEGANCILVEQLSEKKLKQEISTNNITVVVDASHPFSGNASKLVAKVCQELQIEYIRYERAETSLPENDLIYFVDSMEEAAEKAAVLGKSVFLTTGSHQLECFTSVEAKNSRLIVRVLPEHSIIKKCQELGLATKDIIAAQGPFSIKFNKEMFKFYKADVVVTKESGVASGTDTKVSAALSLGIPVIVVRRKQGRENNRVESYQGVIDFLKRTV